LKHPLNFVQTKGLLADALGLTPEECAPIEKLVEDFLANKKSRRELFEAVGELDISDELWANFLYTFGFWDGQRRA